MAIDKFKGRELAKNDYTYSTENKELTSQNESKTPEIRFLTRKQKLGGKRTLQTHDKFSYDNMLKKIKISAVNCVHYFINDKIKNEVKLCFILENKPLLRIKTNELKNSNIQYNKDLLKKKVKDILYVDISGKYRNGKKEKDYNKKLIDKIYGCEEGKKIQDIMGKNFLDLFRYFRKDIEYTENNEYSCLNGLEKEFDNLIKKINEKHEKEYTIKFINFIHHFENFIESRKKRVKKNNNIILEINK